MTYLLTESVDVFLQPMKQGKTRLKYLLIRVNHHLQNKERR